MKIKHHLQKIKSSEYIRILILRIIGNFLVISSLFMIGKTFYKPVREEIRFFINKAINKEYIVTDVSDVSKKPKTRGLLAQILNIEPVEIIEPEDPNFSIVIPKIGANAKVVADVDTLSEAVYLEALKKGVAHAAGTAYPGEGGHVFLFAHSTDYFWNVGTYNAVFYLLYKLEKRDEVNLFYQGHRYRYQVIDKAVVDPSQVEYLTRKTNKEFLTLQTCWPPGTTLKRLVVFAVRVTE
jgi:sortase A